MTDGKVRIDQASLTFAELADIEESLGMSLGDIFAKSQSRGMAALAWITLRRDDPTYTLDQAMQLKPTDIESVESPPEVPGASNGATPHNSAESGASVLPT